jgi:hypothetical protein
MKSFCYSILTACLFILVCKAETAICSSDQEASVDCGLEHCEKSWILPALRIAVVEFSMHGGMLIIWNDSFDMTDVKGNREQFELDWTSPPKYEPDPNVFATDGDRWYYNLVAHSLFGSESYLAARVWGHGPTAAFIFAAVASFTWEYLIESWYKQPSAIDLFWTPMAGTLLGELRYQGYLAAKQRISSRAWRAVVLALLDPLGELERLILGCEIGAKRRRLK